MKTCFIGNSGKFYVKNPFDSGKYSYAVYNSLEAYIHLEHLPDYVTTAKAEADFKAEIKLPQVIDKRN